MRGHTTAENAGLLSAKVGCKVVALNHFGSTVIYLDIIEDFLAEARASNKGKSQIIASYDFLEVWIPRGGFAFESEVSP